MRWMARNGDELASGADNLSALSTAAPPSAPLGSTA
jgi:hypothetical protein